jgi:hypothetical protein
MINLVKQVTMIAAQIKQTLHEYIDSADEEKLEAIYTVLKDSIPADYTYSKDELENIYILRNKYKDGLEPVLTTEEMINFVRQNKL